VIARSAIVAEAREWIGTPFHHQQHKKQVACDCIGLVGGVGMAAGALPSDLPGLSEYAGYSHRPDGRLIPALDRYLVRIPEKEMQPGDVLCLRWGKEPHHLGLVGDYRHGGLSLIHAESWRHKKVVEHRLCFTDNSMKFVAAFRFPGVEA
jgi:NlpC/P60 family putative phage cell wall peptidase